MVRSIVIAACLVAVATAGCGAVPATGAGAHPATSPGHTQEPASVPASTAPGSACQSPADDTLTLASNGKTYCLRVGEHLDVYLRGTVARPWLEPLASSDVLVSVPNGVFSLVAGLTGASFAAARPGQVLITSIRSPCSAATISKNEAEPARPVPRVYPLGFCPPQGRFSVSITVVT
jgi:hypothetical protein